MNITERTIADLKCTVADQRKDASSRADLVVVLCHGYGAPGTDLVGLFAEMEKLAPALEGRVVWVFPMAPIVMESYWNAESRAWFPIDEDALNHAMATGEPRLRREETPAELLGLRDQMAKLVATLSTDYGVPLSQVALGGFSQGSMVTLDCALHLPESPAGLVLFSCTLLNEKEWAERAASRSGLPVFQSHGRQDPLLRVEEAQALHELLTSAGLKADYHEFNGVHQINHTSLKQASEFLASLLPASP